MQEKENIETLLNTFLPKGYEEFQRVLSESTSQLFFRYHREYEYELHQFSTDMSKVFEKVSFYGEIIESIMSEFKTTSKLARLQRLINKCFTDLISFLKSELASKKNLISNRMREHLQEQPSIPADICKRCQNFLLQVNVKASKLELGVGQFRDYYNFFEYGESEYVFSKNEKSQKNIFYSDIFQNKKNIEEKLLEIQLKLQKEEFGLNCCIQDFESEYKMLEEQFTQKKLQVKEHSKVNSEEQFKRHLKQLVKNIFLKLRTVERQFRERNSHHKLTQTELEKNHEQLFHEVEEIIKTNKELASLTEEKSKDLMILKNKLKIKEKSLNQSECEKKSLQKMVDSILNEKLNLEEILERKKSQNFQLNQKNSHLNKIITDKQSQIEGLRKSHRRKRSINSQFEIHIPPEFCLQLPIIEEVQDPVIRRRSKKGSVNVALPPRKPTLLSYQCQSYDQSLYEKESVSRKSEIDSFLKRKVKFQNLYETHEYEISPKLKCHSQSKISIRIDDVSNQVSPASSKKSVSRKKSSLKEITSRKKNRQKSQNTLQVEQREQKSVSIAESLMSMSQQTILKSKNIQPEEKKKLQEKAPIPKKEIPKKDKESKRKFSHQKPLNRVQQKINPNINKFKKPISHMMKKKQAKCAQQPKKKSQELISAESKQKNRVKEPRMKRQISLQRNGWMQLYTELIKQKGYEVNFQLFKEKIKKSVNELTNSEDIQNNINQQSLKKNSFLFRPNLIKNQQKKISSKIQSIVENKQKMPYIKQVTLTQTISPSVTDKRHKLALNRQSRTMENSFSRTDEKKQVIENQVFNLFFSAEQCLKFEKNLGRFRQGGVIKLLNHEQKYLQNVLTKIAQLHLKNKPIYERLKNLLMNPFTSTFSGSISLEVIKAAPLINQLKDCLKIIIHIHRFKCKPQTICGHLERFLQKLIDLI